MTDDYVGTGQYIHVTRDRTDAATRRLDELVTERTRDRQHLWIATFGYLVEPNETLTLDTENMIGPPMVGCLICERPYIPGRLGKLINRARCPGDPATRG